MMTKQEVNIDRYHRGLLMYNKGAVAFKFLGLMFITRSIKRTKKFSFDDYWNYQRVTFLDKLKMVLSRKFKIAKDCPKSVIAGV